MATGSQSDIFARLNALLPSKWFVGSTPVKDAVLTGIAAVFAQIYSLYAYAILQTRVATLTDAWIDTASADYFGPSLPRGVGESDASYLARIKANLLLNRATRPAMVAALTALTGQAPLIIEPTNPADTGAYSAPNSGYNVAGSYGSMLLPFQCFVQAYRPLTAGLPLVAGYGSPCSGYGTPSYGEYADISMIQNQVADAAIYAAIEATRPAATVIWTNLRAGPLVYGELNSTFVLDSTQLA